MNNAIHDLRITLQNEQDQVVGYQTRITNLQDEINENRVVINGWAARYNEDTEDLNARLDTSRRQRDEVGYLYRKERLLAKCLNRQKVTFNRRIRVLKLIIEQLRIELANVPINPPPPPPPIDQVWLLLH